MVTVTKEADMFLKYILWGKLIKFKSYKVKEQLVFSVVSLRFKNM